MANTASATMHDQFGAQDADIMIKSSDGILFNLHRNNLAAHSGAFPGTEIDTQGEIVNLTEPGDVLEIVFQFTYPRKHPKLKDLDFGVLMSVAEAVENEVLPEHAADILAHAIKHDYPDLMNQAAIPLCRSPLLDVVKTLPLHSVILWIEYQAAWQKIFEEATRLIEQLNFVDSSCGDYHTTGGFSGSRVLRGVCPICRLSLLCWLKQLAEMKTISSLKDTIENPNFKTQLCGRCAKSCVYFPEVKKILECGMAAIPPFTNFLNAKGPTPSAT